MLISVVLSLVACDMPGTGGNPYEGLPCNQNIMKVHADSLALKITVNCPYEKVCDVKYYFYVAKLPDSLKGMCFGGGVEWRLESPDTSMVVKDWKSYATSLTQDDHLRFSLFDINNIEKKYDIDLSGIVNSYTVHGDSVDVNVMKGCSLSLYECDRETVYGNLILDSRYSFSILEGCKKYYSYDCLWDNQGPLKKDNLDIHAKIYWKK
ncbi:hypothetical protein IKQ19_20765 [Candidatus Saccharibacteria bacterium]|nr:hypothetical protein [Candidatus Saccharibacteria bacterium]